MNSFKEYLHEQQDIKSLVYAFGRYNPPSRGHILHFQAVRELAIKLGMPYELYISKTVDHKRNPVSVAERIAYIKKALPVIHSVTPTINMFTIVDDMAALGKKRLVYVAGSDYFEAKEEQAMMTRLQSYAKEKGMELTVQMSRQREPEISGTALRQAALNDDFKTFLQASPVGMGRITQQDVARMFELTKQGLSAAPVKAKKKPVV